jgi:hypothetical protein
VSPGIVRHDPGFQGFLSGIIPLLAVLTRVSGLFVRNYSASRRPDPEIPCSYNHPILPDRQKTASWLTTALLQFRKLTNFVGLESFDFIFAVLKLPNGINL